MADTLIPLRLARRELAILKAEHRGEVRALRAALEALAAGRPLLKGQWDESKHHRDHGKFSSGPGAGGDPAAPAPASAPSDPPPAGSLAPVVAAAVKAAGGHESHVAHLTDRAITAAAKVHLHLLRLTPAMLKAIDAVSAVIDTPDDMRKFGYNPNSVAHHEAADPVKAATGVNAHLAATVAAKVLGAGLVWVRQKAGLPPLVKKAMYDTDFEGAAEVIAEALAALAEEFGLDGVPDAAGVAAAMRAAAGGDGTEASVPSDHASLYEALLGAVTDAREAGDDEAVPHLVAAYREQLDGPDELHKAFDESKHPRDDHGRFLSRDAIADAKGDPAKEEALYDRVTDPAEREKLTNALAGTTDLGRTKRGQARHDAHARREKRAADHARASQIADRIGAGTATHEEMHELGDHLEGLTLDKLRYLQARVPTAGRGRRKAEVVATLRDSLERRAVALRHERDAAGVEGRAAPADPARLALAGMVPNRYKVATADGEDVAPGQGYERWEGDRKVGYAAARAAAVAAGVTADHADRRIAEHERAAADPKLDPAERERHGEMAGQLREHKDKTFGGRVAEAAPAPRVGAPPAAGPTAAGRFPEDDEFHAPRPPAKAAASGKTHPALAPALAAHAAAPEGSPLRSAIDAAIGNAAPAASGGLHDAANPPAELDPARVRRFRQQLAAQHADLHAGGRLSPADDAAYTRLMSEMGIDPLHAPGETKPFDPETMEADTGVGTGAPVRVTRRGWTGLYGVEGMEPTAHEGNYRRAKVEPAPKAPAGAKPDGGAGENPQNRSTPVDQSTAVDYTPSTPATPAGGGGKPMTTSELPKLQAPARGTRDQMSPRYVPEAEQHRDRILSEIDAALAPARSDPEMAENLREIDAVVSRMRNTRSADFWHEVRSMPGVDALDHVMRLISDGPAHGTIPAGHPAHPGSAGGRS